MRILQSFSRGEVAYEEFLFRIDRLLATGASSSHLLQILSTDETVGTISREVREAVIERITRWPRVPAVRDTRFIEAPTVLLEEAASRGVGERQQRSVSASIQHPLVHTGVVLKSRFQLMELIGVGGMSRVFKALDLRRVEAGSPDPYIALKVLTLPFHEYFGSIAALQSEAQKLQSLAHPNIIRVFDCDRDGGIVFMTMEYLAGRALLPGPPRDAHAVILAIARALDYAHGSNIVHGDLKPGNVIVTDSGEVKVIDFGIARWIANPASPEPVESKSDSPAIAQYATPEYASPQVIARQAPGPGDDVYSLACLAYQLLTGTHPFDGARTSSEPPPQRPGLSSTQWAAIAKALQFERIDRTPSVREFITQFDGPPPVAKWRKYAMGLGAAVVAALALMWVGHRFPGNSVPRPPETSGNRTAASAPVPSSVASAPAAAGTVIRDCPTCVLLTVLPHGRFQQGSDEAGTGAPSSEYPQHWVTIGYSIAMTTNDVTVSDFREFIAATGRDMKGCDIYDGGWHHRANSDWNDPGFNQGAAYPVTCVSWHDAVAYAQWLSSRTGQRYRLPTASEWEYAARAGTGDPQPWKTSASDACAAANVADQSGGRRYPGWVVFPCSDGYVYTAPVGSFKPNAFGLNDMLGNVFQWTQDCWHDDYKDAPTDGSEQLDGDCSQREMRGGSWFSSPAYVSAAYRNHFAADYRTSSVGFRLVREMQP